jgi:hypothetical protein
MSKLNMLDARCTALFASGLQRSDMLARDGVACDGLARDGLARDAHARDGLARDGLARDARGRDAVAEAVRLAVRQFGVRGCAARMAQEFGDHPEAAIERMRWIRQLVGELPARSARPPAGYARRAA